VAVRLVVLGMILMTKRKLTLADKLLIPPYADGWWKGNLRQTLSEARRFVFDYDASFFVGELVRDVGLDLLAQHEFAKPPFEKMWIEVDQEAYWLGLFSEDKDSLGDDFHGYLIDYGMVYSAACTRKDLVYKIPHAAFMPLGFELHKPWSLEDRSRMAKELGLSLIEMQILVVGNIGFGGSSVKNKYLREVIVDVASSHRLLWAQKIDLSKRDKVLTFTASAGDLKKLLILLLLLTRPKNEILELFDLPRSSAKRKKRRVVYMEHHVVTMHLERKKAMRRVVKYFGESSPRRRHGVTGHWSQTRRLPPCVHVWDKINEDRYECIKCPAKRWWKVDYHRGDASIGFVTKIYEVKK